MRAALADDPVGSAAEKPFRVAGYLPDYRFAQFDFTGTAGPLTDLIVFSAEVTPEGVIDQRRLADAPWKAMLAWKTRNRVRLILCVGGWKRSAGFAEVATSADRRRLFADDAVRLCLEQRFDGLDIDWEHPKDTAEESGYAILLTDLRSAFAPHGLMLSVTLAGWQRLPANAYDAVDWVQVMAYDQPGRHATFEGAQREVQSLVNGGISPGKVVLGLPFYGRDVKQPDRTLTYSDIATRHAPAGDVDEIDGVYFNGPATIRRKTRFARESGLGGVMMWELGQDLKGDNSLLHAIGMALR